MSSNSHHGTFRGASDRLLLSAIVLGGLALRMPRAFESLWYDEIAAWRDYGSKGPHAIITTYFDPANHIAHTLLSSYSMTLVGGALPIELALRLPALLFSLGAIIAVYALVMRGLADRAIALIAALLMAVMPVAILEGAEARGYSMMIFFAAASSWALLAAVDRDDRRRKLWWLMYAILVACGVWAHLTTVFVPIGHAVWIIGRAVRQRDFTFALRGLGGIALTAICTIALYLPVFDDLIRIRSMFSAAEGDEPTILGAEGLHLALQLGGSWYWWGSLAGLLLLIIGGWRAMHDARLRTLALVTLAGLPIMVIVIALADSWIYARFALFALPGAAILMAAGIVWIGRHNSRVLGVMVAIILIGCWMADLIVRPPKQPLREAGAYVSQHIEPNENVLVIGLRHEVMNAYIGHLQPTFSLRLGADLDAKLDSSSPEWLIMLYPERVASERIAHLKRRGYEIDARFDGWLDWGDGDVVVWRNHSQ